MAKAVGLTWVVAPVLGCVGFRSRPRVEGNGPAADADALGHSLIEAHNLERERRGLTGLSPDPRLTAALGHAADMASRRRMSHRGGDLSSPFTRIARSGYSRASAGENVAAGQVSVPEVMRDWMRSPGHRRNVLGNFQDIGAGIATDSVGTRYWCVTFGRVEGERILNSWHSVGYPTH